MKCDPLSTINNALSVGSKLSFTGGFLALVWYCMFEGVGFPIKSVSQAVSTFAVAFVLFMLIGALTVYSYMLMQPVLFIRAGLQRRANGGRFWSAGFDASLKFVIGLFFGFFLLVGVAMTWQSISFLDFLYAAVAVSGTGMLLHLLVDPTDGLRPKWLLMMAPMIILLLIMMAFGGTLIAGSMTALGIRSKPGQLVTITSSSHEQVQALAAAEALTVKAEQIKDQWLYPTATVLWSGLGGPATVKFEGERRDLRMTLPEANVQISSIDVRKAMPIKAPVARGDDTTPASE